MRLLRIRLRNFRGVEDRAVEFLRDGVTVVVGPNEIGKSSMAEAIDLLIEELDTTWKQTVRDVKPVHRDAGPEVEADIESGQYAFTYHKRFLKDRETTLRVSRPRPESLTGREAHERAGKILGETMDVALWKALRIVQGAGVGQASLRGAPSLGQALDHAAGTVPEGPVETSLFDKARAEYLGYFTDTGRPLKRESELRRDVAEQEAALTAIDDALRAVARDVERHASLSGELASLGARRAEEQERLVELERQWKEIEVLRGRVEALDADARAAGLQADARTAASAARSALVATLAAEEAERDRWAKTVEAATPDLQAARVRVGGAGEARARAGAGREAADAIARMARADLDFRREEQALASLIARRTRLAAAREAMAQAEAVLRTNVVDAGRLQAVRDAGVALRIARGMLEAARPSVGLTALRDVDLLVAGRPLHLASAAQERQTVADSLTIELPGELRIDVAAGAGDASLAEGVTQADRAFRAACEAARVEDVAAAEAAHAARVEAERAREQHRREAEELLGGDASRADALAARIAEAERKTVGYLERRDGSSALPADPDAAALVAERADAQLTALRAAEADAEREDRTANDRLAALEKDATEALIRHGIAAEAATARAAELAAARMVVADGDLAGAAAEAEAQRARATGAADAARATLTAAGPDRVAALLDNARRVTMGSAEHQRALEDERLAVATRLRDHGEDGLAERRDAAISLRDAASDALERHLAKAAARRLLYDTLREARDAAHLAYIGPLRDKIESLGSVVFGEDLAVDLGEDLRIRSRTLGGRTVPFSSLSVGAQEQLGVITRLACAMLVAEDGGVPVILDDTLGYADPGRLEAMGAVLALAGKTSQVIVLTCYPERYRHVGGAKTVMLD